MKKFLIYPLICVATFFVVVLFFNANFHTPALYLTKPTGKNIWQFQSIDTMKYSRDLAKEKLQDASFDAIIERQMKAIADTGATHVAIATPYDEEFIPFLKRWVSAARKQHLKVWFRGNFSGWEGWFGYIRMSRGNHIAKTREFIMGHPELFENGDAFTSCPECENGGSGDPRKTGDVTGYRNFLISEYDTANKAFKDIGRRVTTNYFSMNADVARLIMDRKTTERLGGIVTIDHYVKTPEKLAADIRDIARSSGGHIVLGEFGVPIPDINGNISSEEQAQWISTAFKEMTHIPELVGMNYWVSVGGSTELWDIDGIANPAVDVLESYYHTDIFFGRVFDEFGFPISDAIVRSTERETQSGTNGYFEIAIPFKDEAKTLSLSKGGYLDTSIPVEVGTETMVTLIKERKTFKEKCLLFFKKIVTSF